MARFFEGIFAENLSGYFSPQFQMLLRETEDE